MKEVLIGRVINVLAWSALSGVALTLIVFGYFWKLFVVIGVGFSPYQSQSL